MKDHEISLNRHCPCTQPECPILGNCVLCIQNHLEHKRHIPECIQNILRPAVQELAGQMELKTQDGRPNPAFWEKVDRERSLKNSLEKHKKEDEK